jgi:hypothetical protein
MTEDIKNAFEKVNPGGVWITNKEEWKILFDWYNNNLSENETHLHMGCRPCYFKVYHKVKRYLDASITQN